MSRLQKKCFVASVAMHSTLVLVLFFGAAFLTPKQLKDPIKTINVIPRNIIESTLNGGGGTPPPAKAAPARPPVVETPVVVPPPPAPPVETPRVAETPPPPKADPPPRPEPVAPQPVRETPAPVVTKKEARPIDRVAPKKTAKNAKAKEAPVVETNTKAEKTKTKAPEEKSGPKVDLSKMKAVSRDNRAEIAKQQREYEEYQAAAAAASKARADQAARLDGALSNLKNNLSSGISIEPVGGAGEGFANYGQVVVSIYENAWVKPPDTSDDYIVQVSVTIARNGSVVRASIVKASRNAAVNRSVQRTLDGVKFIAPFPAGSKDSERTFNIDFNLKQKTLRG